VPHVGTWIEIYGGVAEGVDTCRASRRHVD